MRRGVLSGFLLLSSYFHFEAMKGPPFRDSPLIIPYTLPCLPLVITYRPTCHTSRPNMQPTDLGMKSLIQ